MKRQVIKTDWANGGEPVHVYEDHGPGRAESRPAQLLDGAPYQGRENESGGKVRQMGAGSSGTVGTRA